jgi:hypothetical protein
MSLSKTLLATCGIATMLLAAVPLGSIANAESVGYGAIAAGQLDPDQGPFRHLRALQDIASASGGNRAAATPGYDRSAEYVAQILREAGYIVRFEEFEFPFFEDRTPPVLITSQPNGEQVSAGDTVRSLTNSGSNDVTARLRVGGVCAHGGRQPGGCCRPFEFNAP